MASTGAIPTVETAKPRAPANRPFAMEPAERVAIRVREKTAIAKYSWGPKRSATLASSGAMSISAAMLNRVPRKENTMPIPSALTPWPCSMSGPPSNTVAMEEGVPGIFSKIAEISPPEVAPMNSATSSDNPACGPMVNVRGRHRATAMVAERPGTAPKTIPTATPIAINIMIFSENTAPKPCCKRSSMLETPRNSSIRRATEDRMPPGTADRSRPR